MIILNLRTKELSEIEKQRLVDIYFNVFSASPRKEIINKEDIYNEMFTNNNYISLLSVDNELSGYCLSTEIEKFSDFKLIDNINNGCYISVLAIVEEKRKYGFGKILLNQHLLYLTDFFNEIYTRSRVDIKNVVDLFLNEDFKIIKTYESEINIEKSIKHIYFKKV